MPATLGGTTTLIGCLALAFLLLLCHTRMSVNMNLLVAVLLFVLSILITTVYHGDEFKQFAIYAIYIVIAFIVSQTLKADFNVIYVRLFYFCQFFRWLWWSIFSIPAIIRLLPTISNEYGLTAHTAVPTITSSAIWHSPKPGGVWEPEHIKPCQYQCMIVLFSKTFEEKRVKYLIVFAITVFNFSTTGYIVFCGLLLVYCLNEMFVSKTANVFKYVRILIYFRCVLRSIFCATVRHSDFNYLVN